MGGLMDIRRMMMLDGLPDYLRLPSAYEKLAYITADGHQSLRTNYVPVQNDELHIRYKDTEGTIISAGTGTYQLVLIGGFSGAGWYYKYFSSATVEAKAELTRTDWYDLDIDSDGVLTTNGFTFTRAYQSALDGSSTTLWLAERRNATQPYAGSIAEFWIKNNGQYKMYLIPCRRKSDMKVGMYDTIGKVFYSSATATDFIAG